MTTNTMQSEQSWFDHRTASVDPGWRSRFNAWFFRLSEGYAHAKYRHLKRRLFTGLPETVVEIGAGTGTNLRYLVAGTHLVAIEPNVHMHRFLERAAARRRVSLEILTTGAEDIPLPDASVDVVLSSLVLCSVSDRARVLGEIRRILRPGGRFLCIEHVAAPAGSVTARVQRWVFRPWRWIFDGCHTHPDTREQLAKAGFQSLEVEPFTWRSAFVPVRPQIAATAVR